VRSRAEHDLKGAAVGFLHRHHDNGTTRYRMREKLFAIGDDFWIETEDGDRAFKVDGKALRIRDTFVLKDADGEDLFKAQAKKLHVRDTMKIERDGDTAATIKKALITPLRDRFSIDLADGTELKAKGNILEHEYKIERDGDTVAEISKRWFRVRDTYGIEIAAGQDDALVLTVAACIEEMEEG
jgi:uncharacterized protein YxjI